MLMFAWKYVNLLIKHEQALHKINLLQKKLIQIQDDYIQALTKIQSLEYELNTTNGGKC
jgi:hypothetical protein